MSDLPTPPPLPSTTPPTTPRTPLLAEIVPLLIGTAVGLLLRWIFDGEPGERFAPMLPIFFLLAPAAIGAVTVFVAERLHARSVRYHVFAPMATVVLVLIGSMAALWEGIICVLLALPAFLLLGSLGGVVMGLLCRHAGWSKTPTVYGIAVLPLLLGLAGVGQDTPVRYRAVERRLLVQAPPAEVWKHLLDADRIRAGEVDRAWMYRIGVPLPLFGLTHQTPTGLVREVRMGRGIAFRQMSAAWQPQRRVRWQYLFDADSVPPRALDDHVRIGGHYFDLRDTTYTLTPRGPATELAIRMEYRVSTGFNWYAVPVADWLIGDFSEVILDFYRRRAEAVASAPKGPAARE